MNDLKLKPCPHCGYENISIRSGQVADSPYFYARTECCAEIEEQSKTEDGAIVELCNTWNQRASDIIIEKHQARIVELKQECERLSECLERKTEISDQLKDSLTESFERESALAAHVSLIKNAYRAADSDIQSLFNSQPRQDDNSYLVDGQSCTELGRIIMDSPQNSLANKDAEAARKSYIDAVAEIVDLWEQGKILNFQDLYDVKDLANGYAERIKRGE